MCCFVADNLLIEQNGCVKSCRVGYHNDGTGTCVQCKDKKCDKGLYEKQLWVTRVVCTSSCDQDQVLIYVNSFKL